MRKVFLLGVITICAAGFLSHASGTREMVPKVQYKSPKDEVTVDLTGVKSLVFTWKAMPMPGGGRMSYRFTVYKGFGYERVLSDDLNFRTYSVEVPSNMFENGQTYSWQVKQRDAGSRIWSMDYRWSFTVKKGEPSPIPE